MATQCESVREFLAMATARILVVLAVPVDPGGVTGTCRMQRRALEIGGAWRQ